MADDVTLPGTGVVIAADDVTSVFYQKVKVDLGADGATSPLVRGQQSGANSIPVVLPSDQGTLVVSGAVSIGGTTAVSAASLPLPSGAATAAKQPALGTAGTASTDVISVQGIASMTAIKVDGSGVTQPVSGTVSVGGTTSVSGTVSIGGTTAVSGVVSIGGTTAVSGTVTANLAAGTNAVGKLSANSGVDIGDVDVTSINSFVAHDSPVAGAPLLAGFEARTSDGTAVASGDSVRGQADTLGKQVVVLGSVHDLRTSGILNMTTVGPTTCIATVGATTKIAVTAVLVTNAHATVGTTVEIRANATAKIKGYAAPNGGGFAFDAGGSPLFVSAANDPIRIACGTTGANVDVTVSGYTIIN